MLAAAVAGGAAPRLAALDMAVRWYGPYGPGELPALALEAWLSKDGLPRLRHLGIHGAEPSIAGLTATALARLTSLDLDTAHASSLSRPYLSADSVAALAARTPRLEALALREGVLDRAGRAGLPLLPPSLTRVSSTVKSTDLQETHTSIVASLLALPSLAALAVGTVSTRSPLLAPGPAPPPGRAIDLALNKWHLGEPLTVFLDPTWVLALTALTLTGHPDPTHDDLLTDLAPARRLAALTLEGMSRADGPVPPSLAAGLTSLTVRLPRRQSHHGFRMAWPAGGWPALRSLTVCTGQGHFAVCSDDDGGGAAADYDLAPTLPPRRRLQDRGRPGRPPAPPLHHHGRRARGGGVGRL
jgi:hypothetical protein